MPTRKKGMKRAHLKRFSSQVINGGQGVDSRYIAQFKENSRSFGRVRQGLTIELDSVGRPLLPGLSHPHPMPITRPHVTESGTYIRPVTPEREKVLYRLKQEKAKDIPNSPVLHVLWQASERGQRYEDFVRVLKKDGKYTQVYWYFSGERSFFVQVTPWDVSCSYMYTSRDLANQAYHQGSISWVEVMKK